MYRVWGVVVALLLVTAGCSGSKADDSKPKLAGVDSDGSSTTTPAATPDAKPKSSKSKAGAASGSTTTTTTSSTSGGSATTMPNQPAENWMDKTFEITVTLKESCVRPGGTQTITVKTEPGAGLAYDTTYPDGKSGVSDGYYGGNSGGFADENGDYADTFAVAATAPSGYAVVSVLSSDPNKGHAEKRLTFYVADVTGNCP
jgi:ABC-type glycerol-3-phosphate transport system substrate-binding protein